MLYDATTATAAVAAFPAGLPEANFRRRCGCLPCAFYDGWFWGNITTSLKMTLCFSGLDLVECFFVLSEFTNETSLGKVFLDPKRSRNCAQLQNHYPATRTLRYVGNFYLACECFGGNTYSIGRERCFWIFVSRLAIRELNGSWMDDKGCRKTPSLGIQTSVASVRATSPQVPTFAAWMLRVDVLGNAMADVMYILVAMVINPTVQDGGQRKPSSCAWVELVGLWDGF